MCHRVTQARLHVAQRLQPAAVVGAQAEAAIERLAAAPTDDGLAMRDIRLLRRHALLARAQGDAVAYAPFRDRYRDMAGTLGFDGRIAWAEDTP
ncbi:MAG: hypothetical protein JOY55_19505 [Mycobacterium sp.]|nr:hypothetical protein [Mycobacterium sp.]MBV8293956.1 hypothetical protein [Mycobacterium sp.]